MSKLHVLNCVSQLPEAILVPFALTARAKMEMFLASEMLRNKWGTKRAHRIGGGHR